MDAAFAGAVPHLRNAAGRQVNAGSTVTKVHAMGGPDRRKNLRTALVLVSIALVFFIGVIVNRMLLGG